MHLFFTHLRKLNNQTKQNRTDRHAPPPPPPAAHTILVAVRVLWLDLPSLLQATGMWAAATVEVAVALHAGLGRVAMGTSADAAAVFDQQVTAVDPLVAAAHASLAAGRAWASGLLLHGEGGTGGVVVAQESGRRVHFRAVWREQATVRTLTIGGEQPLSLRSGALSTEASGHAASQRAAGPQSTPPKPLAISVAFAGAGGGLAGSLRYEAMGSMRTVLTRTAVLYAVLTPGGGGGGGGSRRAPLGVIMVARLSAGKYLFQLDADALPGAPWKVQFNGPGKQALKKCAAVLTATVRYSTCDLGSNSEKWKMTPGALTVTVTSVGDPTLAIAGDVVVYVA